MSITAPPWSCELSEWTGHVTIYANKTDVGIRIIAEFYGHDAEDNGRIAAAAPDLLAALKELHDRCVLVKARLDAGLPDGAPVHPQSSDLTWPLSTAGLAIAKAEQFIATRNSP